ncbi:MULTISPECIES: DUF1674 domain-containing protein [Novosphingobium]|uniref:DUF1674 domain-containing protein n=1 Tax=Novosphingobium pentaromativorans TaxID=205844 RepID=A0A2W5NUC4_9SPHN|nr:MULTISPECIES: DUF1674 domain-containing protein [Novosphingobium]PZQ57201.1 MAG: DUF1674 domain-containing protein [Novosphingobium pentaromativorans]GFE73969.1 hypothetical protein NTCA1_16180 [Novosphingobium sp. TCA1]
MTQRSTKRPEGFTKPAHWTNDPAPAPTPEAAKAPAEQDEQDPDGISPTRYGDWVRNGIAIDF